MATLNRDVNLKVLIANAPPIVIVKLFAELILVSPRLIEKEMDTLHYLVRDEIVGYNTRIQMMKLKMRRICSDNDTEETEESEEEVASKNEEEATEIIESAPEPKRTLQNLALFTLALLIPVLISFFLYNLDLQDWEVKLIDF